MANVILRPDWRISERLITPEAAFLNRRQFLRQMGLAGGGLLTASQMNAGAAGFESGGKYPAKRHPDYNPGWRLTDEKVAGTYNNFYEFSLDKSITPQLTAKFATAPWPIEISGLVEKPMTIDAAELIELFPLEERVYRFRCVEAWAMIVPWTGFPLSKLVEKVSPKPEAKFLRFETFNRPEQAPAMKRLTHYPVAVLRGLADG